MNRLLVAVLPFLVFSCSPETDGDSSSQSESHDQLVTRSCFDTVVAQLDPSRGTWLDGGTIASNDLAAQLATCLQQGGVSFDGGLPSFDAGIPLFDAGIPSFDAGVPSFDAGIPSFDAGIPSAGLGAPCSASCACPATLRCVNPVASVCPSTYARCLP